MGRTDSTQTQKRGGAVNVQLIVIEQQIEEIARLKKALNKLIRQNAEMQEQIRQHNIRNMKLRELLNN